MLKNYIKIAFRTLWKHKVASVISIGGLATGMAMCLLIAYYVSYETSYDEFHEHAKDLYRVTVDASEGGELKLQSARVAPAVASFQEEIPEITNYTRMIILGDDGVITFEDEAVGEPDIYLADNAFFDMFSFPLIQGNPVTSLSAPFSVVLSDEVAVKLFGTQDPIGKSVIINSDNFDGESLPFEVTGVLQRIPSNSHISPQVLISYPTLYEFVGNRFDNSWDWNETYTYFQLAPGVDPVELEEKFSTVFQRLNPQQSGTRWQYHLQPITDIHLYSDLQYEADVNGSFMHVYFLSIACLFILIVGYINHTNLSTVRAIQRAAEVGVRKVTGASDSQLIMQFLTESFLINLLAVFIAFILYELLSPWVAYLFNFPLFLQIQVDTAFILFLTLVILLLFLVSGIYPAHILSKYNPSEVLSGSFSKYLPGSSMRKFLVAGQFAAFIILVAISLTVYKQVEYMKHQDTGFNSDQIVVIRAPKSVGNLNQRAFSQYEMAISPYSEVVGVSGSAAVPGEEIYQFSDRVNVNGEDIAGVFSILPVVPGYFNLHDIQILEGEPFNSSDADRWIINEVALELFGFDSPAEAIGKSVTVGSNTGEIRGIVKNYHHENFKVALEPILFSATYDPNFFSIKINSMDIDATLANLQLNYEALFPGSPFEAFMLDEFYEQKYENEEQFALLFGSFSAMGIFLAFIGLFGLSNYSIHLRTKEIGIRKVMGATITQIIVLLNKDVLKLVILGFIVATPVTWFIMNQWLNDFAYRIEIGPGVFFLAGSAALLIAFASVSSQSVRAALANPVDAIRGE